MAKRTPSGRWPASGKSIKAVVRVHRGHAGDGGRDFVACVRIGKKSGTHGRRNTIECVWAKNPRKAVAGAFRQLASSISKRRGGAFRGIR